MVADKQISATILIFILLFFDDIAHSWGDEELTIAFAPHLPTSFLLKIIKESS